MEASQGLIEAVVLLALASAALATTERLRLPSIVGFLVVGAVAGPGGLGLVSEPDRVRSLAELGVVFLLFEIGLELPLERMRALWRPALVGGGFQVVISVAVVAWIAHATGMSWPTALVIGAGVAMSSTAIVLQLLTDEGQIDAPGGQMAVAVLLLQDLAIVPFLLVVPLMAGDSPEIGSLGLAVGRMGLALAFSIGALVWTTITWNLSRAGKLRAFERVMGDATANMLKRLEATETRMIEYRAAMESLVDQADELHMRAVRERKRVAQENVRAGTNSGVQQPFSNDRQGQLAQVRALFTSEGR